MPVLVVPVQTAWLADLNDLADLRRLHSPRLRAAHIQGLVAAPAVVLGEVVLEDPPQMPLALLKDGELMPQGEQLEVQRNAGVEHGDHGDDQCDEDRSPSRTRLLESHRLVQIVVDGPEQWRGLLTQFALLLRSADFREGITSIIEKRTPNFEGR